MSTYDEIYQQEQREKYEQIAHATMQFLQQHGYYISWDGEQFVVTMQGIYADGKITGYKYDDRQSAYLKALELAAKDNST